MDLFPGVWQRYVEQAQQHKIALPKEIYQEIVRNEGISKKNKKVDKNHKNDCLANWLKEHKETFVIEGTDTHLTEVLKAYNANTTDSLGADPYLIAMAMEKGATIATKETEGERKIPTICKKLNIECIDDFSLLEELKFSYPNRSN